MKNEMLEYIAKFASMILVIFLAGFVFASIVLIFSAPFMFMTWIIGRIFQ